MLWILAPMASLCPPALAHLQELDPAAASLVAELAQQQAAAGAAPITLIDGAAVHQQYLAPLLPHPEVRLTSWVAKVHALCWVTSFAQVGCLRSVRERRREGRRLGLSSREWWHLSVFLFPVLLGLGS